MHRTLQLLKFYLIRLAPLVKSKEDDTLLKVDYVDLTKSLHHHISKSTLQKHYNKESKINNIYVPPFLYYISYKHTTKQIKVEVVK